MSRRRTAASLVSTCRQEQAVSALEIRSVTIKQGHETQFAQLMRTQSLPLLQRAGTDVVAFIACLAAPLAPGLPPRSSQT